MPTGADLVVGGRVVIRYRLPAGGTHPMTDVIGLLRSADESTLVVATEDGRIVTVRRADVVNAKALSARPVRNSEIRAVERAAAEGWPGLEQQWIDGWLLRAGGGFTGRANSATPLGTDAGDRSLDAIEAWYRERGLPPRLLLPDRLGRVPNGWTAQNETSVMTRSLTTELPKHDSVVLDHPDASWIAAYNYRGGPVPPIGIDVISAVRHGVVGFLRMGGGVIARAAVTASPDGRRWVGLTAVEVPPAQRRAGLATAICRAALAWGREQGATDAYLQVAASNVDAVALYESLGFAEHHRYRYAYPCAK